MRPAAILLLLTASTCRADNDGVQAWLSASETQCRPGWCPPQYHYPQQRQPAPQQRLPEVGSPGTPQFQSPPPLEPVKPIPPPIKGCDCGPKWAELEKEKAELEVRLQLEAKARADLVARIEALEARPAPSLDMTAIDNRIAAYLELHPVSVPDVPTTDELAKAVLAKLPPFYIRVQDSRGAGYSTEYQPVQLGQYVTLPFGPAN